MATSFSGALMESQPVVFTSNGLKNIPKILCRESKKAEALDLLDKMGLIEILIVPDEPSKPLIPNRPKNKIKSR
jgi:hypothetical protein